MEVSVRELSPVSMQQEVGEYSTKMKNKEIAVFAEGCADNIQEIAKKVRGGYSGDWWGKQWTLLLCLTSFK